MNKILLNTRSISPTEIKTIPQFVFFPEILIAIIADVNKNAFMICGHPPQKDRKIIEIKNNMMLSVRIFLGRFNLYMLSNRDNPITNSAETISHSASFILKLKFKFMDITLNNVSKIAIKKYIKDFPAKFLIPILPIALELIKIPAINMI